MAKKTRWMYNNDKKHFFKKIPNTNEWEEYTNKSVSDTFEFLTYDVSNIILYNKDSAKYIQLSDSQVKIANGSIENLDNSLNDNDGFWIFSDRVERKIDTFCLFSLEFFLEFS